MNYFRSRFLGKIEHVDGHESQDAIRWIVFCGFNDRETRTTLGDAYFGTGKAPSTHPYPAIPRIHPLMFPQTKSRAGQGLAYPGFSSFRHPLNLATMQPRLLA